MKPLNEILLENDNDILKCIIYFELNNVKYTFKQKKDKDNRDIFTLNIFNEMVFGLITGVKVHNYHIIPAN